YEFTTSVNLLSEFVLLFPVNFVLLKKKKDYCTFNFFQMQTTDSLPTTADTDVEIVGHQATYVMQTQKTEGNSPTPQVYYELKPYHPFRQRVTLLLLLCIMCFIESIVGMRCASELGKFLNHHEDECSSTSDVNGTVTDDNFSKVYRVTKKMGGGEQELFFCLQDYLITYTFLFDRCCVFFFLIKKKKKRDTTHNLLMISVILFFVSLAGALTWYFFRRKITSVKCRSMGELNQTFGSKGYLRYTTAIFLGMCGIYLVFWVIALVLLLLVSDPTFPNHCTSSFTKGSVFVTSRLILGWIVYPVIVIIVVLFIAFACITRCCCLCVRSITDHSGNIAYECYCSEMCGCNICF
ncbi:hypothetical protein RFI_34305, partial [Reticulomyxa filosa]